MAEDFQSHHLLSLYSTLPDRVYCEIESTGEWHSRLLGLPDPMCSVGSLATHTRNDNPNYCTTNTVQMKYKKVSVTCVPTSIQNMEAQIRTLVYNTTSL